MMSYHPPNDPNQWQQQPHTNYPPQQPYQPPPPPPGPPPKKKRRVVFWIIAVIAVLVACSALGNALGIHPPPSSTSTDTATTAVQATDTPVPTDVATDTPAPTEAPTKAPVVKLQHWTFSGNGTSKTTQFTTSDSTWKLSWKCDPAAYGFSYNLIVDVDGTDGSTFDSPVNVICKSGVTSGSSEEYNAAGTFYLKVDSEASWSITIQEQ